MHEAQPRHANTQKMYGCTRRHRHVTGHTFGTISLKKRYTMQGLARVGLVASNKNVRHTSLELGSFATTDCRQLCRVLSISGLAGELHHKRHVNLVENSIRLSANLDGAALATYRLCTGFMLRTTRFVEGSHCLRNAWTTETGTN